MSSRSKKNREVEEIVVDWDWDEYSRFRPPYPPSLVKLILDYHRAHNSSLRLAHDVGSGSGVFAVKLAEHCQHIHISDPEPSYVEKAKQRFDKWFGENPEEATVTFSVTRAEEADEAAAKGSVDLISLMECMHWTDVDVAIEAIARSLKSDGTLAVLYYHVAPTVVGNESVNSAVSRLFTLWGQNVVEAQEKDSKMITQFLAFGWAGLEGLALPDRLFKQELTRRIDINIEGRGETPYAPAGYEYLAMASRADPKDVRRTYTSNEAEGMGWRYEVNGSWFRGMVGTIQQESKLHLYENQLQEIERLVKETSPNDKVEIEWTVGILLATRR